MPHQVDVAVFRWIYHWPDGIAPFMVFMSDATRTWPARIGLIVLFLAYLFVPRLRWPAIAAVVAVLLSNTATDVLKHLWPVMRPTELFDVIPRAEGGFGPGTASAHSANMAAVAAAFYVVDRRWGWAWAMVALVTGLSRIYVGVHYPSQVLLGWAIGLGFGFAVSWVVQRIVSLRERPLEDPSGQPRQPESQPPDPPPGTSPSEPL